jgi:biotin carboxyl carrier protein
VRFEVETGPRRRTIEVQRSGDGWAVTVDGRSVVVDLARAGNRWSMLMGSGALAGDSASRGTQRVGRQGFSHEIAIEPGAGGKHLVHVDGHLVEVTLLAPGRRHTRPEGEIAGATGPITVSAPMPGRVVRVLVTPGDTVAARQGLVVVEAMKMENELRAPRAGTVAEVRVREGAPVEANVVLVVIT